MVAVGLQDFVVEELWPATPQGSSEAETPQSPAASSKAGGGSSSRAGRARPPAPMLPLGVCMGKHLFFSHDELESMFRLFLANASSCGELSLVGLQVGKWGEQG